VESLPENSDGLVWVTKAELRAVIDTREAAIRGTEAGLDAVRAALVSEDEIAHGEASDGVRGLGECAYCDMPWPCRTQRGIDRLLARLSSADTETP
jgi:hypothetical protein